MRAIPKVASRVWIQGRERLPQHLADLCDGFDRLHPGWRFEWYDHERICDELDMRAARQVYLDAELYVPPDSVNQMRADIARYAILRQHGGVTLDVDYLWLAPIETFLRGAAVVLCYETDGQWVANGFAAANPKHTLYTRALDGIPARAAEISGRGLRANAFTGPKYLTPLVESLGQRLDLRILPSRVLHPVPWSAAGKPFRPGDYPDSAAIHLWGHQLGLRGAENNRWKTWGEVA